MQPADLSEFRLLRALRAGQPGAFPSLWNGIAGDAWSVLRALVDTDLEALGWMNSFRVDLAERAPGFDAAQALGPQVGAVLLEHADRAFSTPGEMPAGPLEPDERGVRALPPAVRLRYLVDLFFDVPAANPEVRRAYTLLEPSLDTDARMLVHAALLRRAPASALLLPPGSEPTKRPIWGWVGLAVLVGTAAAVAWTVWPRAWDPTQAHDKAIAATHDLLLGDSPDALSLALTRRGVSGMLADVPDLSPWQVSLLGARMEGDAVVLLYREGDVDWTLQHVEGANLPEGEPSLTMGDVQVWSQAGLSVGGWKESSGAWLLVSAAQPTRVLEVAAGLRDHRLHPVPPARSVFDAL